MSIQELQTSRLDINNNYEIDVTFKQLDDIVFKVIIYDKSLPADLNNYTARLKAFKSDQVPLIQNTQIYIDGNEVTIKGDPQLATTSGIIKSELQFINKTTLEKKSTFYININVIASVLETDRGISVATCTLLKEIDNKLDQIENIGTTLEDAVEINDALKGTTIPAASSAKSGLETSIDTGNTTKAALDKSKSDADTSKLALDTSIKNANSSKDALDQSKTNADTSKAALDESIKEANEFAQNHSDVNNLITTVANINSQMSEKANNTDVILNDNTEDMYLGIFFDDSAEYNNYLYSSKDGEKFTRLSNVPAISGLSSPSILYYNGIFYCLVDKRGMTTTLNNFTIYTSKNLKDWSLYDIALGDVVQGNNKVYGCDWFFDDNGKIYITYSKQIGLMPDGTSSNFRPYIVEVTNLENLEFGTPTAINLDNYNRIDTTIIKSNGTYYLFSKKEKDEDILIDGTISIWTSSDLIKWTKQTDTISSLVGYKFEGPCICNVNGIWHLYIDDWGGTLNGFMHYCTSSDLINWSFPIKMQTMSRLRHGSVIKVNDVLAKKVINNFFNQELLGSNNDSLCTYNKYFNGINLKSSIANKYIELFEMEMPMTWTAFNIKFKITDTQNAFFNSEFILCGRNQSDLNTLSDCVFKEVNNFKSALANNIIVVSEKGIHRVFLNIGSMVSSTPTISIIDFEAHSSITLNVKNSNSVSALPSGTQTSCVTNTDISSAISTLTGKLRLSKTYPSLANTTVTLSFYGLNGVAKIMGHTNGYTESQMIDYNLMLLNGNIALVKMDSNGATISVTKNSYSNLVYNLTITVPAQYSVIDITLPVGSYFIS